MRYYKKAIKINLLTTALLCLCACQRATFHNPQNYTQPAVSKSENNVIVKIMDEPTLSKSYSIDDAGMILMPLIGKVQVNNKNAPEIEQEITKRLQDGYILHPKVSVKKEATNSFYIIGAVKNPGRYNIPDDAALLIDAIAIAGGYAASNKIESVELIRKKNGEIKHHKNTHVLSPLRAGDTIIIRGSSTSIFSLTNL